MLIIAHRGSSGVVPENTELAIATATSSADIIEIDVQITKDHQIVLFHDRSFERIDGDEKGIGDYTYQELCEKDVGKYFKDAYHGMRIPRLEDVLMKFRNFDFIIELKPEKNRKDSNWNLEENVLNILDEQRFNFYNGYISVRDFDSYEYMINHGDYRVGVMQKKRSPEEFLEQLNNYEVAISQIRWKKYNDQSIKRLSDNVAEIYAYPGDFPHEFDILLKWDVDGILTNFPSVLQGYLELIGEY